MSMTWREPSKVVLLYDGDCPLCRGAVAWIGARAIPGTVEMLPCRAEERLARFPQITDEACQRAMQLVLPDGRVLEGADALPEVLRRLRRWRWLAYLFRLPGAGLVAPLVYRWVARHRHALSGLLAHKVGTCSSDACERDAIPPGDRER